MQIHSRILFKYCVNKKKEVKCKGKKLLINDAQLN